MTIKIIHPDGSAPSSPNVDLCNAATHVAARDQWAWEAKCLLAYNAGDWDHWIETDSGEDWAEYEYDHESAKASIRYSSWDHAAQFAAQFPDGDGTGAADVEVCVEGKSPDGEWVLAHKDGTR